MGRGRYHPARSPASRTEGWTAKCCSTAVLDAMHTSEPHDERPDGTEPAQRRRHGLVTRAPLPLLRDPARALTTPRAALSDGDLRPPAPTGCPPFRSLHIVTTDTLDTTTFGSPGEYRLSSVAEAESKRPPETSPPTIGNFAGQVPLWLERLIRDCDVSIVDETTARRLSGELGLTGHSGRWRAAVAEAFTDWGPTRRVIANLARDRLAARPQFLPVREIADDAAAVLGRRPGHATVWRVLRDLEVKGFLAVKGRDARGGRGGGRDRGDGTYKRACLTYTLLPLVLTPVWRCLASVYARARALRVPKALARKWVRACDDRWRDLRGLLKRFQAVAERSVKRRGSGGPENRPPERVSPHGAGAAEHSVKREKSPDMDYVVTPGGKEVRGGVEHCGKPPREGVSADADGLMEGSSDVKQPSTTPPGDPARTNGGLGAANSTAEGQRDV